MPILSEQEILALAISNEDEDSRIYRGFAEGLREPFPASAKVFDEMADEEVRHRTMLFDLYREKFGEYLPLIRRQDVKGFIQHSKPLWLMRPLGLDEVRKFAESMEYEAERFYRKAAETTRDASVRQLLTELAEIEAEHETLAHKLGETILTEDARAKEDETQRRMFVLQYVQPGLAGLMDGSVSTLAPLFAAAFATHNTWETFLVGMAASVGAGISMGFAEALSDDGSLTGRGTPWMRGTVCGLMTTIGGIGHTLPYLIPDFWLATVARDRRGRGRARGDLLDPLPLHGHAVPVGGVPGHGRRRAGVSRRDFDRQLLNASSIVMSVTTVIGRSSDVRPRPSLRSASGAAADAAPARAAVQARARLSQLAAQAPRDPSPRRAGGAGRRSRRRAQPDHIAVTGDLVNLSLANEFAPGARLARAARAVRATSRSFPATTTPMCRAAADFAARHWADSCAATAAKAFPFVRRRGPLALIGLSTSLPTPPFAATGRLARRPARAARRACWPTSSASRRSASC